MKVWGRKRRLSPRGWTNIVSLEHRTLSDVLLLAVARPAGPRTYRGVAVSNETAAGKVAAARIVPMATALETEFASLAVPGGKDVSVRAGRHRGEEHDHAGCHRWQVAPCERALFFLR